VELKKWAGSPVQHARRRWLGIGGLAAIIVVCLIGVVAHQLGGAPLPPGVIASAPLPYSVSGVYSDHRRKAILAIYGGGLPLPYGHHVVMIDADSGNLVHDVDLGAHMPSTMAVDENTGRVLITFSDSITATLIDSGSGRIVQELALPFQPFGAAFDPDNGYAVVSGVMPGRNKVVVGLVSLRSGLLMRTVTLRARRQGQGYGVGPVVFDGATHRILIASPGGVNILDSRRVRLIRFTAIGGGDPDKIVVDGQAHKAYVTLLNSPAPGCSTGYHRCSRSVGAYVTIDDRDGAVLRSRVTIPGTAAIGAIGLSARMNRLYIGDYGLYGTLRDGRVYVVDTRTGRSLAPITTTGYPSTIVVDDSANVMIAGGLKGISAFTIGANHVIGRVQLPVDKVWAVNDQGDLIVSNHTYDTDAGGGLLGRVAAFLRTTATAAGIYHHMNSGVSIVRLGIHRR